MTFLVGNDLKFVMGDVHAWRAVSSIASIAFDHAVVFIRNICQKRLSERLDRLYKQNMWRVYKHTGKDNDYEVYKEALNAATNEVRKSRRNFEHKLAQHIKSELRTQNSEQFI